MKKENIKGRGTSDNPPNRFERLHLEEDEENYPLDEQKIITQFFTDTSKSVISKNDSPDVDFTYSFNPYRGCEHGCVYCYARPSHSYLGFSAGLDFETKIMVKPDAHLLLEEEFRKKSYKPDVVIFSGNTDCYQPVEKKLMLTRKALEVCLRFKNPVSMITKSTMVQRDIDILSEMSRQDLINVTITMTTLDKTLSSKMEPRASAPMMRIKTLEVLSENKIPCSVNIGPVVPGLTDEEIPEILKLASEAGAESAGYILLRLPFEVKDLFVQWLEKEFPERKNKIINRIKETRSGKLNDSDFSQRFTGTGEFADLIKKLFEINRRKYGLDKRSTKLDLTKFAKPENSQYKLF